MFTNASLRVSLVGLFVIALAVDELAAQVDGTRDPGFASNGLYQTDIPVQQVARDAEAHELAIQTDGRILLAGTARSLDPGEFMDTRVGVVRLLAHGVADPDFGTSGKVRLSLMPDDDGSLVDGLDRTRVALGPLDEIYVATALTLEGFRGPGFALARLRPGGALETTFGSGGVVWRMTPNRLRFADIAVQADGKVLVLGDDPAEEEGSLMVLRYHSNGALDSSFGQNGKAIFGFPDDFDQASALAIQPDGRIVVAGTVSVGASFEHAMAAFRLTSQGNLDPTFGSQGRQLVTFGTADGDSGAFGTALDASGRVLLVGRMGHEAAIARLLPNGLLDSSFDGDGKRTFHYGGADSSIHDTAYGVVVQGNDKPVVVGDLWSTSDFKHQFTLARFNPGGAFDSTFSGDGRAVFEFHSGDEGTGSIGHAVALTPGGKIVAAGSTSLSFEDDDFVAVRLHNALLFADGFESAGTSAWSASAP
jgi:uncharacterized delta-60 repeat protein